VSFLALVWRSAIQAKYILVGSAVVLSLFQLLLIAQAAEIETSQAFGRMAEFVPVFLQKGLGSQAMLLATFKGTVSFGYFHPVVVCVLALIAVYLATEPAHEVESGLVDLVLARAVPRRRVLTRSVLLSLTSVAVIVALMLCSTSLGLRWLAPQTTWPSMRLLLLLAVHLVAAAWCCGAIGLFLAASSRRWSTAFTSGALLVIVAYLIDFLAIGWPPARALAWFAPFQYFPALTILGGTANTARDLSVLFTATAIFVVLAYWRFEKRDL
jgi:ABC-type transport system involved in multi-copper enzyme maturation permease subunit